MGRSFPEYRKVLRLLTNDRVDDIATLAAVDLARLGERVSDEMVARIIKYLSEARGLYGKAETLFYSLSALGKDGARVYQSLLSHSSPSMRSRAWERHLNLTQGWKSSSAWIPALEDRDLQVREAVIKTIRGRVQEINEKDSFIKVNEISHKNKIDNLIMSNEKFKFQLRNVLTCKDGP